METNGGRRACFARRRKIALTSTIAAALLQTVGALCTHHPALSVVDNLYGKVDSHRALKRDALAKNEVDRRHGGVDSRHDLTYGEFDLHFFERLLARAAPTKDDAFLDVGSGCGRLVVAAALLHPTFKRCTGVELLDDLHALACAEHAALVSAIASDDTAADDAAAAAAATTVPLAPCEFLRASFDEVLPQLARRAEPLVVFVYATCWPGTTAHLPELSRALASMLRDGSRVVTVDKQLVSEPAEGWGFSQLGEPLELPNWNTHASVGYVYELVRGGGVPMGSGSGECAMSR